MASCSVSAPVQEQRDLFASVQRVMRFYLFDTFHRIATLSRKFFFFFLAPSCSEHEALRGIFDCFREDVPSIDDYIATLKTLLIIFV